MIFQIPYKETGLFSKFITDYLSYDKHLEYLYQYKLSEENIEKAILNREKNLVDRKILKTVLEQQYHNLKNNEFALKQIGLLKQENCFTICCAHQPNILGGPLYTILKIAHCIKWANYLNDKYRQKYFFVPVFYIGSEDADLEELNHITVNNEKFIWQTKQTGAVGRMKVDDELITLIDNLYKFIGSSKKGNEIIETIKAIYLKDKQIADCSFELFHHLFGEKGLLILNPDNKDLKKCFLNITFKELEEQFSYTAVQQQIQPIANEYKIQALGREINLFYLHENKRLRIKKQENLFVLDDGQKFTLQELKNKFTENPSLISPNVILRPLFQETILPNIAFVGGAGEIAYWLELKKVFDVAGIHYPILALRQSLAFLKPKVLKALEKLNLNIKDLFSDHHIIFSKWVMQQSKNNLSIDDEINNISTIYNSLKSKSLNIDVTLGIHLDAIKKQAINKLEKAAKKLIKAEKRKHTETEQKIWSLKQEIFPQNILQERVDNLWGLQLKFDSNIIEDIMDAIDEFLNPNFKILIKE